MNGRGSLAAAFLILAGIVLVLTRGYWLSRSKPADMSGQGQNNIQLPESASRTLRMSEQARKNLKLVSKPLKLQSFWRTIEVPGEIVDRPGYSDRGVTSPAVGVVTAVHAFPGDMVMPGDLAFYVAFVQRVPAEHASGALQGDTRDSADHGTAIASGGAVESRRRA